VAIAAHASTTITVAASTRERLSDYKRGDATFDDVLNFLMDQVPIEDIAYDQIVEHYRRLATFRGEPANKMLDRIQKRLGAKPKAR
jgi:hypothetical protein